MNLKTLQTRSKRLFNQAVGYTYRQIERRFTDEQKLRWLDVGGYGNTSAGVRVTPDTSMQVVTVYACVNLLSRTIAALPLNLFRRKTDGTAVIASNHPLQTVLHRLPNEEMTSYKCRETMFAHILLWGNAYAEIIRNGAGQVVELWPIHPSRVTPKRDVNGKLYYEITLPPGQATANGQNLVNMPPSRIHHLKGLGPTGVEGYSVIALAREAIAAGMAAQEYANRFFSNDSTPLGFLSHPGQLGTETVDRLEKSWEEKHGGLARAHKVAILEEGLQWVSMGIPAKDAQLLEQRRFSKEEIATLFGVPQHLVGNLEKATFSNIEHQGIEYVVHSITPWAVNLEQQMDKDLLTPSEQGRYFTEHNVNGLLRGDTKSRFEAYGQARRDGWMSADDIRDLENLPPLPDEQGKTYIVGRNMVDLKLLSDEKELKTGSEGNTNGTNGTGASAPSE